MKLDLVIFTNYPCIPLKLFLTTGRQVAHVETANELLIVKTEDGEVFIWRPDNLSLSKSWNAGYSDRWPSRVAPLSELGVCQGLAADDSQVIESQCIGYL